MHVQSNLLLLKTGLTIFGVFEDPDKEFLLTATLNTKSDPSTTLNVWFTSYGKSVELYLVIFKPYFDLKVKLLVGFLSCKVIAVQPCFGVDEKRIKEYNISMESIHFSETIPARNQRQIGLRKSISVIIIKIHAILKDITDMRNLSTHFLSFSK